MFVSYLGSFFIAFFYKKIVNNYLRERAGQELPIDVALAGLSKKIYEMSFRTPTLNSKYIGPSGRA